MTRPLALAAARDNAAWCALVARHAGVPSAERAGVWLAEGRTPAGYPEAVTLRPDAVLAVETLPGPEPDQSVKDSFCSLELTGAGFRVLFEADWIARPPREDGRSRSAEWRPVGADRFDEWVAAHGEAAALGRWLLDEPGVSVLELVASGATVGTAVLTALTSDVVGVSNVVVPGDAAGEAWHGIAAAARRAFGDRPVVGYEHGGSLDAALGAGFERVGALRIWLRDGVAPAV